MIILWQGKFSWTNRNMSCFQDKALKYICHLRWWGVFCSDVQSVFLCCKFAETATNKRVFLLSCQFICMSYCLVDMFSKGFIGWQREPVCREADTWSSHHQQDRSSPFQFKWSLRNETEFLLRTRKCLLSMNRSFFLSEVFLELLHI